MSDRDYLLAQIRQAIAEDPEIDAISLRPDLKALIGLDWIDGVMVLEDTSYDQTQSGRLH